MSKGTEDTLWASMRALEEKAQPLRRMAARSERKAAASYQEEAEMRANHSSAIREKEIFTGNRFRIRSPSRHHSPPRALLAMRKLRLRASPFLPLHL